MLPRKKLKTIDYDYAILERQQCADIHPIINVGPGVCHN